MSIQAASGRIDRKWEIVEPGTFDSLCDDFKIVNKDMNVVLGGCADQPTEEALIDVREDFFIENFGRSRRLVVQVTVHMNATVAEPVFDKTTVFKARLENAKLMMSEDYHNEHLIKPEEYWFSEENRDKLQVIGDVAVATGNNIKSSAIWATTTLAAAAKYTGWF